MDICGHWLPVGDEGQQGGSSNVQRSPPRREAASRRAAALLLNFMVPRRRARIPTQSSPSVTASCAIPLGGLRPPQQSLGGSASPRWP